MAKTTNNTKKKKPNSVKVDDKIDSTKNSKKLVNPIDEKLQTVSFQHFDVNNKGVPVGVFGRKFNNLKSNQIRVICGKVDLVGTRNVRKHNMIDALKDGFLQQSVLSSSPS